ncbi:MAG: NAD(P)-binding protein, partial [Limisphaerales bacterium]
MVTAGVSPASLNGKLSRARNYFRRNALGTFVRLCFHSEIISDGDKNMHCVIGSGPAGVACATALCARGANVLMLDAGIELEAGRVKTVRE